MTIYVFIGMFHDIIDETKAFDSFEKAEKAFKKYTKVDYSEYEKWQEDQQKGKDKVELEAVLGDYVGSQIYELEVE